MTALEVKAKIEGAKEYKSLSPLPLIPKESKAGVFPTDCLGKDLSPVVNSIHELIQAPLEICSQSVLAAVTLVMQGYANVKLPTGQTRPISNFFMTIAESGERKSSCDQEAMVGIKKYESERNEEYKIAIQEWKDKNEIFEKDRSFILNRKSKKSSLEKYQELDQLTKPTKPSLPFLLCEEPTSEGLYKLLQHGQDSMGIFSAEGGQFLGGHSLKEENKIKTISDFSKLWDGESLKRVRAGEEASFIEGKRVSMHLMIQPSIANKFLNDPLFKDQGFLSRFLISKPKSLKGLRVFKYPQKEKMDCIQEFSNRLYEKLKSLKNRELGLQGNDLPSISLSKDAEEIWIGFADYIESLIGSNGKFEEISGLANKLPEHALRIAATLALFENSKCEEINCDWMNSGITLAEYYAEEALRIYQSSSIDSLLQKSQKLLNWLHEKGHILVAPSMIYQNCSWSKNKSESTRLLKVLEDHHWVFPVSNGAKIKGKNYQEVWRVQQKER